MTNNVTVNGASLDEEEGGSFFVGIIAEFLSEIKSERPEGIITTFNQSVGVERDEAVFIIFDQQVTLRSMEDGGPFVFFYQNIKDTEPSKQIITFNQKVMP